MNNKNFNDYNEILCQSINNLIDARLQSVKFDETIICKIINNSEKDIGKYTVSNGSLIFEATSDVTTYANEEQVYVLIPQGDYSAPKTIINRYKEQNKPIMALQGLDTTVQLEYCGADDPEFIFPITSDGQPTSRLIQEKMTNLSIPVKNFNNIILQGQFKIANTNELLSIGSGTYGLRAFLVLNHKDQIVFELDARKDMFGDPMKFYTYFKQAVQYPGIIATLDEDSIITDLWMEIYQNGQFINAEDTYIEFLMPYLILGYDISLDKNIPYLKLIANNYGNYTDNAKRVLSVFFCNLVDGKRDILKQDNLILQKKENNIWIDTYADGQSFDPYNGVQIFTITLDSEILSDIYRVKYKHTNGIEYISNIINFINDKEQNYYEAFTIVLGENSTIHYPVYDDNNQLVWNQRNKQRYINVALKDYYKTELIGNTITWRVPKHASLLKINEENLIKENWNITSDEQHIICSYTQTEDRAFPPDFFYELNEYYQINWNNNTLICEIEYNGQKNIIKQSFTFSSQGISGTAYSLEIVSKNNLEEYLITGYEEAPQIYMVKLYNPEGIDITELYADTFSWKSILFDNDQKGKEVTINTYIPGAQLEVSVSVPFGGRYINLSKKIPIAYGQFEGLSSTAPNIIYYDYAGKLVTSPTFYEINLLSRWIEFEGVISKIHIYSKLDNNYCYTVTENNSINIDDSAEILFIKQYAPSLKDNILTLPKTCSKDFIDSYHLVLSFENSDEELIYEQPILLEYDSYTSNVLNEWNASDLIIDDEGNKILTAFMAAGIKNIDNHFTGVLIGDFGKSDGIIGSGILGMQAGKQTFKLDTSGKTIMGAEGTGQIVIDGTGGKISSGSNTGMEINLAEGKIQAKNFELTGANELKITNTEFNIGTQENNHLTFDTEGNLSIKSENFNLIGKGVQVSNNYFCIGDKNAEFIEYLNGNINANLGELDIVTTKLNVNATEIVGVPKGDEIYEYENKLILNNSPNMFGYYFYIGNQDTHLSFSKQGAIDINTTNFNLESHNQFLNLDNILLLSSSSTNGKPQFKIGNANEYVNFEDGALDIQIKDLKIHGNNTNAIFGANNGFTPWICDTGNEEFPNIREIRWDNDKQAYILSVYKQSNINDLDLDGKYYSGIGVFYDCSHLIGLGQLEIVFYLSLPAQDNWYKTGIYAGAFANPDDIGSPFVNYNEIKDKIEYDTFNGEIVWDDNNEIIYSATFTEENPYLIIFIYCAHQTENTSAPGVLYNKPFEVEIKNLSIQIPTFETQTIAEHILNTTYNDLSQTYFGDGIYMSGGKLAINASAIKTGILSSGDGELQWNLNTGQLFLRNDAVFISNDNFAITDNSFIFKNTQSMLSNTEFKYYTPTFQESGTATQTPLYYYKEAVCLKGLVALRSITGKNESISATDAGKIYRIITDSAGTPIETYLSVINSYVYKIFNNNTYYYVSTKLKGENVFDESFREQTVKVAYDIENITSITGNKLVLSDTEESVLVLSSPDGATGIKITGSGITTWGNYSTA